MLLNANRIDVKQAFANARGKTIRTLDGIVVDLLVRTFEADGDIELVGELEEDQLVIVRGGRVVVDGFCGGHIVAEGDITVKGNAAAGFLVSKHGDIHVEDGLSRCRLIAKSGKVVAKRLESPACVFGWHGVFVDGGMAGGRVLGRNVEIGGEVTGGQAHAAGALKAKAFRVGARSTTVACLRTSISCEDYGRPMEDRERKLRRSIGKHTHAAQLMQRLIRYATRDIHDSQRTTLYVLLGANVNARNIRSVRGLQCQMNFLTEIIGITQRLYNHLRWAGTSYNPEAGSESEVIAEECLGGYKAIGEDLQTLGTSFDLRHKNVIYRACADMTNVSNELKRSALKPRDMRSTADEIFRRLEKWRTLLEELTEETTSMVSEFGVHPDLVRKIESEPEKLDSMLGHLHAKFKKEQQSSERAARVRLPIVRLIQTQIDRHKKNVAIWQRTLDSARAESKKIYEALGANSVILFADDTPGALYVEADEMDAGVKIVIDPVPNEDPAQTARTCIELGKAAETLTRFRAHEGELQRTAATGA